MKPTVRPLVLSCLLLCSSVPLQAAPKAAPAIEIECQAECWNLDLERGYAWFGSLARTWGTASRAELMWDLRDEQCPFPGVLVHSSLASLEESYWHGDFTHFWRHYHAGRATRVFHRYSTSAWSFHSSIRMEFNSATPGNSCRRSRATRPIRNVDGVQVGG